MKRIIVILSIVGAFAHLQAQTMTMIPWNERKAGLYYYGSNWIDSSIMTGNAYYNNEGVWLGNTDAYFGRPCVTEQPMRVLGIAGASYVQFVPHTTDSVRLPEYFTLYQHEGDSIEFVASTRWDTVTPHYIFEFFPYCTNPLYEAFFEKPVMVHDTFYVGGTTYNNMVPEHSYPKTQYVFVTATSAAAINPDPSYLVIKLNRPITITDNIYISAGLDGADTSHVQIIQTIPGWPPLTTGVRARWLLYFAIFDTNYVPGVGMYDDSCVVPTGLHSEVSPEGGVAVAWNAGGQSLWQLSVYPDGNNPNNEPLYTTSINYVALDSLEEGHWYHAMVRTLCDTDIFGMWSDEISFYIGNPDDTISCVTPSGLQVLSTDVGKVVLQWNVGTNAVSWVTEVGPVSVPVGGGMVAPAPTYFTVRNGLDTATWHWARVRAKCGEDWMSLWSDTVMFYIPGTGSAPVDTTGNSITLAEQYTYLMPNPAREEVTVASSFRMKAVELYGADGKLLQRKEVNAVGTTLDLKGLPAGIYFVRVVTHAGVTTKRLVIE